MTITNIPFGICFLVLLILPSLTSLGQSSDPIMNLGKEVQLDRYQRVQGSPYFYKDWQLGSILSSSGAVLDSIALNFNGESKELEFLNNEKAYELIPGAYIRVTIAQGSYSDIYMRGIHPKFGLDLVCISYNGQKIKLVKSFQSRKEETNTSTTVSQKFLPTTNYFLITKGQLENISIRKKKIIKILGYEEEIETYLEKNNNSLKTEPELIQLLSFYEEELLSQ